MDLGLWIRRLQYHFWRVTGVARVGSRTLAQIRADALRLWATFNNDDELVATGLFPWEEDILNPPALLGRQVLIVGCGSGRDVLPLIVRGAIVSGVDPSPEALGALRRALAARRMEAQLFEGFIEEVTITGQYDLIYFSYYCYSYMPLRERRIAILKKMIPLLKPGGQIVVSAIPADRVNRFLFGVGRVAGALFCTDWRFEPGDHVWPAESPNGRAHYLHVFRDGEVEDELRAAGFTVSYRNLVAVLAAPPNVSGTSRESPR